MLRDEDGVFRQVAKEVKRICLREKSDSMGLVEGMEIGGGMLAVERR